MPDISFIDYVMLGVLAAFFAGLWLWSWVDRRTTRRARSPSAAHHKR